MIDLLYFILEKVSSKQEVKEYNDLMTWMDNEFWEQADE